MGKVPFFGNPDDTHCFQAVIRMLLKYQFSELEYSWSELDRLTGKKEGLWTWPLYAMLQLNDMGFEIINMEDFDYYRFAQEGPSYLKERLGEEVGTEQIEHSDIRYEMKNAALFLQRFDCSPHIPGLKDISSLISQGFLVICNVNSCMLNGNDGYSGHFILVYGVDDTSLIIHDPGPPPRESRIVPHDLFVKAWAFPAETEKNLMAFRYRG
jgi:hypothetical protein